MTSPTRNLLPMTSGGCSCCSPSSPATDFSAATVAAVSGATSTYGVEGMTCGGCASRVTKAVKSIPEVEDVSVDLETGGVSALTVTGPASPEAVREAVQRAGYTVLSQ